MAGVTAALAIGASAVGGAMSASAQGKQAREAAAAAGWMPKGVSGAGGMTNATGSGGVRVQADERTQAYGDQFFNMFHERANGGGYGGIAGGMAEQMGTQQLPGAFNNALLAGSQIPQGAFDAYTQNAVNNAQFGQNFGQNMLGQAAQFGGRQTGNNEALAQNLFGRGFEAMNKDFSQLSADQLSRSRALARPMEERAVNSKFQGLFNRGILEQKGGQNQIADLAQSQEMADIQRQNSADMFASNQLAQNRAFGGQMIGQGLQGRGMDQQFNLGAGNMFAGMGQNAMNFGAQQAAAGLGAQTQLSDMRNTRGQQRLSNVQQMLGFGGGLQENNFNQMLASFGAQNQIDSNMRNLIALSLSGGQAASQAGANQGNFLMQQGGSPVGSFLGGVGSGLMGTV